MLTKVNPLWQSNTERRYRGFLVVGLYSDLSASIGLRRASTIATVVVIMANFLMNCGGPWGTVPELFFEKKELIPALQQLLTSHHT